MAPTTLITHSGAFHADDLLAFAVLSKIYPDNRLIRTRDQRLIDAAGENAVVFDVGGTYDPDARRYDHHQPGRPEREPGRPYSAFGLIWKHHGHEFLAKMDVPLEHIEEVWSMIDEEVVSVVDDVDNGTIRDNSHPAMHGMSLASMLGAFQPAFDDDDPNAERRAFNKAEQVAKSLLEAQVQQSAALVRSRDLVRAAVANRERPEVVELPRWMPYLEPLLEADPKGEVLFVVFPSNGAWNVNTVKLSTDTFDDRHSLPQEWAGLRNEDLAKASGVEDAVFCHMARFIAVASSREGAMRMVDLAVPQNDHEKTTQPAL
jgi:uncharacterized UPF0160 family protein